MKILSTKNKLVAAVAAGLMVVSLPGAASADQYGTKITKVGSAKVVSNTAIYENRYVGKVVIRVIANFSNHTKNSVKLTTYKLCFSQTSGGEDDILSSVRVGGKVSYTGPKRYYVASSSCTASYKVNKTYKAAPGKELFVIYNKLGFRKMTFLHGFTR